MEWKSSKEENNIKFLLSFYPILATTTTTRIATTQATTFIYFESENENFINDSSCRCNFHKFPTLGETHTFCMMTLEVMHISSKKVLLCNQQNNAILTFFYSSYSLSWKHRIHCCLAFLCSLSRLISHIHEGINLECVVELCICKIG